MSSSVGSAAQELAAAGRLSEALALLSTTGIGDREDRLLAATLRYDSGLASQALEELCELATEVRTEAPSIRFDFEYTYLGRAIQFLPRQDVVSMVSTLRRTATAEGSPRVLARFHLAVAKAEAHRGAIREAATQFEIASKINAHIPGRPLSVPLVLIDASLRTAAGDLHGAARSTSTALGGSPKKHGKPAPGILANAAQLALWTGDPQIARRYAEECLGLATELAFVRGATLDTMLAIALFEGDSAAAQHWLEQSSAHSANVDVPRTSVYDLCHQITRCHYFAQLEDWRAIVDIVTTADQDLHDRQLRTWRASLLSAKAKALAHLGEHDAANAVLLEAMAACPKEAIDPKVTIEAATGTVLALRGDTSQATAHFDRAHRACQAIGHRFLEWVVEQDRTHVQRKTARQRYRRPRTSIDLDDAALVLADVSSLLSAGHSIDLLAQRGLSVLEATRLRSRISVVKRDTHKDVDSISISADFDTPHGCQIELVSADRTIRIEIRDLESLEELTLITHVVDLMRAALPPGSVINDDQLWPDMPPAILTDAVFWSPRMQELVRVTQRLAATDLPMLITGETGTGKEVFARLVHEHSRVRRGPFVPFNASAIPRDLVESQLFGHRRGAFTGALESAAGVIRSADQGTLFLDEIGDLDPLVQPKLLRFLEAAEVHPVGENRPLTVQVRIVAATNARLEALVSEGRFRSDLLFRLRVAAIDLPPLRERKDEIPALTAHFVRKAMAETRRVNVRVGDDLVAALLMYDWPGNLRELSNELRRVVAMADDEAVLRAEALSPAISGPWFAARVPPRPAQQPESSEEITLALDQPLEIALASVERRFIERAMTQTKGNVSEAAALLGISRKGLFVKRRRLGLR